jgi:hypothetical protein
MPIRIAAPLTVGSAATLELGVRGTQGLGTLGDLSLLLPDVPAPVIMFGGDHLVST